MTTYELLREGEWTNDGRMLEVNSVTWEDQVPLVGRDDSLLGSVTNIRRDGNDILGDVDVPLPGGVALTCSLRLDVLTNSDDGVIGHSAVLLSAHVNDRAMYPWPERK